jgi:signal transduction histidine kinase/ActR/RegA family two-component response regulator
LKAIVVEEDRTYAKEQLVLKKIVKALEERRFYTIYLGVYGKKNEYQRKKFTFTFVNNEKNILALSVSDVTDFYKAEEEKRESLHNALEMAQNANFAKTEFLSRMSHELRTPLNAIMGLVILAQEKAIENKELLENLTKINSSAHYLLSIINDVLDMSRIESGKLHMSKGLIVIKELVAKVNAIIESQAKQKEIQYTWEIAESVYHSFVGDELKLQQVLINILGNAVKFTPDGGKVHLQIEQVFFFNTEQKRKLRITISDTGIGIEKKFLPHIFDAFSQDLLKTRSELAGTGLGLAISKNLITIMGGTISVESVEGEGTSFVIELVLPIYDEEMENKKNNLARFENQGYMLPNAVDTTAIPAKEDNGLVQMNTSFYRGNRILLVDDNRMNLDVAEQLLVGRGFSIDIATNGKEAVEKFENSKEGFYNLILMDVRMPQMDGLEATRTIRALEHPNAQTIPIIAMTANAFAEDIKATQESGMNAHLSKPIDTEILFQTIACFISGFC